MVLPFSDWLCLYEQFCSDLTDVMVGRFLCMLGWSESLVLLPIYVFVGRLRLMRVFVLEPLECIFGARAILLVVCF